jgi:RNase P protein component
MREAIRPLLSMLPSGWDLILIARPALTSSTLEETRAALLTLLYRAHIIPVDEH